MTERDGMSEGTDSMQVAQSTCKLW